ncbi:MAG: hypothetical protein KFF73_18740 [Cyclobacteriaceae bacterium]|nr:hypothetical protein [Cyclobacteriaceae bacterium]
MIRRNLNIYILFLVLIFSAANILPDISFETQCELTGDRNQPVKESQDTEGEKKGLDDQDLMNRTLSGTGNYPLANNKNCHSPAFHLDHPLDVISPPPETFFC